MIKYTPALYVCALLLATALSSTTLCMQKLINTNLPLMQKSFVEKMLDGLGKSRIMTRYNKQLGQQHDHLYYNTPLASDYLQQLGSKAQTKVGIPKKRQVALKNIRDKYNATYKYICLDEYEISLEHFDFAQEKRPKIKPKKYGPLHYTLLHEATHIKYNDHAAITLITTPHTLLSSPLMSCLQVLYCTLISRLSGTTPTSIPHTSITSTSTAHNSDINPEQTNFQKKLLTFIERRADIESLYATDCHICASQKAHALRNDLLEHHRMVSLCQNAILNLSSKLNNQELSDKLRYHQDQLDLYSHYLTPEEIGIIAAYLKKNNKLCDIHSVEQE